MNRYHSVFIATLLFFLVELTGGFLYNSLALVTDAAFMAINLAVQLVSLYVRRLSTKPPDKQKTFGYERAKVIAGLVHGILVGFMLFYVLINAYNRLIEPETLETGKVFVIAVLGFFVNGYGVYKYFDEAGDIGSRGAFLFILNDTLGSVGVIISTLIISYTGYYEADAIASIFITLLVIYPSYVLVRESINILMESIPSGIEVDKVEQFIKDNFERVRSVKELHIWSLVPEKRIMTVKIRTDGRIYNREKIKNLKDMIKENFNIQDVFLEVYEED